MKRLVVVRNSEGSPGGVPTYSSGSPALIYAVLFTAHPVSRHNENPHYAIRVEFLTDLGDPQASRGSSAYVVAAGLDYGYLNRIWRREALEELPRELVRPMELYASDWLGSPPGTPGDLGESA